MLHDVRDSRCDMRVSRHTSPLTTLPRVSGADIVFVVIMVAHGPRGQRCCSCCPQWCSCSAASKRLEASQQMIELPQIDMANDPRQVKYAVPPTQGDCTVDSEKYW